MQSGQRYSKDWTNNASPDDLITAGLDIVNRIATLDQTHQRRFVDQVQAAPKAVELLQKVAEPSTA